ncbi:MAG: DUF3592 domain-containing protein [Bernardetiaceae bacterium]|jgi:hypothetical protein|nr:DUF3592 domain-containing protein [Bernardetiaceae bacterium]
MSLPILAAPPRRLALNLVLAALFGNMWSLMGWIFMGICLPVAVGLGVFNSTLTTGWRFMGDLAQAPGQVIRCEETGWEMNDADVWEWKYSFDYQGRNYIGKSYQTAFTGAEVGTPVTVEFAPGTPGRSRIVGQRESPVPAWFALLMGGTMLLMPLVFLGVGSYRVPRYLRLLRHGHLAQGQLSKREPTNVKVNNQTVYKYAYSFVNPANRREYQAYAHSHHASWQKRRLEIVLFDPEKPSQALVLAYLPGEPFVNSQGELELTRKTQLYLLAPLFTLLVTGLVIYLKFIR